MTLGPLMADVDGLELTDEEVRHAVNHDLASGRVKLILGSLCKTL